MGSDFSLLRFVSDVLGSDDYETNKNEFKVYPNPASDNLTFTFSTEKTGVMKLNIFNELGQTVASLPAEILSPGMQSKRVDVSHLHAGTYFYSLETGDAVMRGKVFLK